MNRIVIVGASIAGLTAAQTLRREGFEGHLTLVGAEPHLPYDRPPLSKQVLAGTWEPERIQPFDTGHYADLGVHLRLGRAATAVDLPGKAVVLDDERLGYDGLIIATGVCPRRPPWPHVHVLRTVDDAVRLRTALRHLPRLAVIGAGFLGAEVAATARTLGCDVTLIDPAPQPMARQLGSRLGARVARLHREHGVIVRTTTNVRRVAPDGVETHDGGFVQADLVVAAIGCTPATAWLAGSGLPLGDGIECDDRGRAAPAVYAAGDVASWHNPAFGTRMRLEHRLNAAEHAAAVARNLLGADRPYAPIPYFWSDQFTTKIQAYGILPADAEITLEHGELTGDRFVVAYRRHGHTVGLLGWNSPRELRTLRAAWRPITPATRSMT
ncbi:NAD(P)/FAD-dependent oxidoreductase [Nonomuraea sp. NPDC059023]|uniref:NAD(P)/FAD-dependent oxidoreductase n=1 Tax=unclassified Nonomuraea TaxID=2593643 RepID=UPI0036835CBA